MSYLIERLLEEGSAEAVAGIGDQRIHAATIQLLREALDPLEGGQVGLDRFSAATASLQVGHGSTQRSVGSEDQIESVFGAFTREREPYAARSACYDGQWTCCRVHAFLSNSLSPVMMGMRGSTKRTT